MRFAAGDRALYATDGSNYRQVPIGVVIPRTIDDVVAAVRLCREHGAPILSRGGGTSLAGQCDNVAVVIDFSKYLNRILEIDPERAARARRAGRDPRPPARRRPSTSTGSRSGPIPPRTSHCTLGGMIGNNSCGVRSVMAQFYGPGPRMLGQRRTSSRSCSTTARRLRVGATTSTSSTAIIGAGGRRGEIYARCATCATATPT